MDTVADLLPVLGLRFSAGPLELRGITDDDLVRSEPQLIVEGLPAFRHSIGLDQADEGDLT